MTGFHWKLKLAVITLLSGSIAAIFSILLLFSTINHTRLYKEQTRNYCRNFTLQVATDLTNILEKYEDKMDSFIDDPQFRNLLEPSVVFPMQHSSFFILYPILSKAIHWMDTIFRNLTVIFYQPMIALLTEPNQRTLQMFPKVHTTAQPSPCQQR